MDGKAFMDLVERAQKSASDANAAAKSIAEWRWSHGVPNEELIGYCRCKRPLYLKKDADSRHTIKGELVCERCHMTVLDDLPLGVSHAPPPQFEDHTAGK